MMNEHAEWLRNIAILSADMPVRIKHERAIGAADEIDRLVAVVAELREERDAYRVELAGMKRIYDERVTELLAANNGEVQRRRQAERAAAAAEATQRRILDALVASRHAGNGMAGYLGHPDRANAATEELIGEWNAALHPPISDVLDHLPMSTTPAPAAKELLARDKRDIANWPYGHDHD